MQVIAEIYEQDIHPNAPIVDPTHFTHREAVRAVVVNEQGQVALLNVSARGYHKLPGGGIEAGESKQSALAREIMEELGCRVEVIAELGQVFECRDQQQQTQTSFTYLARQVGYQGPNAFTQDEIDRGFQIVWTPNIAAAIALFEATTPTTYDGQRIVPRDLLILRAAKRHPATQRA